MKPILCLDFDGVCHLYVSKWEGPTHIPDPPVIGLFEFLERAHEHFRIVVYSSRSRTEEGIAAMQEWFCKHAERWRESGGYGDAWEYIEFVAHKPAVKITLDDRALTFTGEWPDMNQLIDFRPWNK